jgi:cobalt-zinc-cadmium efflux system outer membrane protein
MGEPAKRGNRVTIGNIRIAIGTRIAAKRLAFALLFLSGCATPSEYTPDRPLPPPPRVSAKPPGPEAPPTVEIVRTSASVPAEPAKGSVPTTLGPEDAIRFALQNNPMLAAVREQRGFARGAVVIAHTYPFNPVIQVFQLGVSGPKSAGITNHNFNETTMRLDLELRGQGRHRRAAAEAGVTRTEWDIATQELLVMIATDRAFNTVIYRQRKLQVLVDTVALNEQVVDQVKKLVDLGRLRPADLVVARTELDAARAQLGQGKTALAFARADLRRQFGTFDDSFEVKGDLELPAPTTEFDEYARVALERRPDIQSRKMMVAEAQARLRLQIADRYGNPSIGPAFEYDDSSSSLIGMWFFGPIPVLNTRKGEIMQAQATVARITAEVHQFEVQSAQDVQAALMRLAEARKWADSYKAEVLPSLRKADENMRKLLDQNEPGVDVIKVIGVQRNYLRAFDAYLDAQFEVSQARADLSAAVGDPAIAVGLFTPSEKPSAPLPTPEAPGKSSAKLPIPKLSPAPAKNKP